MIQTKPPLKTNGTADQLPQLKSAPTLAVGLEGVTAAQTRLSRVDGQNGELLIAGFPLEELALNATFEETVYLLWHNHLPNQTELANFQQTLAGFRALPQATISLLQNVAKRRPSVMDTLRMAGSTLSLVTENEPDVDPNWRDTYALLARFPTIIATYWRLLHNQTPIAPYQNLGHSANYLAMLTDDIPSTAKIRGLETYLNTVVDHGLNASTFTARIIISTRSDLVSAIVGAIGALKGPLHGGAPGPALDMVFEIGTADRIEPYLQAKLERGERLMGFGHRVYKVYDPRAAMLAEAARQMYQADGDMRLYTLAQQVEETALRLLAERKPGRSLRTNVEYYTALLLHGLALPTDLFSPTFAMGRVGGWLAHCFEQQAAGRLIRPTALYNGEVGRQWIPLTQR